jgi:hypothetical protein
VEPIPSGRLFTRTFEVWRRDVPRYAVVGLVGLAPVLLGSLLLASREDVRHGLAPPNRVMALFLFGCALPSAILLVGTAGHGALDGLAGRPLRARSMVRAGVRALPRLVATGELVFVGIVLGLVVLVVPGLVLAGGLLLALPAAEAEGLGPLRAMRRSWDLTRGYRPALLLGAVGFPFLFLGLGLLNREVLPVLVGGSTWGTLLAELAINSAILPLPAMYPAVAFREILVAKEGAANVSGSAAAAEPV